MASQDPDQGTNCRNRNAFAGASHKVVRAQYELRRSKQSTFSIVLLILCGLSFSSCPLHALDPRKEIGQYGHDSWTSQRGLPGEAVYQILQSRDGYLWLRTGAGLARFDGVRFVSMDAEIGSETVKAIAMSADGDLLIRTTTRTVVYRDGKFSDYLLPAPLPDGGVRVLFESREHVLFLGSDDFIYRLDQPKTTLLQGGTSWINDFLEDHSGQIWVAGETSLFIYRDGHITRRFDMASLGTRTDSLIEDRQHRIWAGTASGLYSIAVGSRAASGLRASKVPNVPAHVTATIEDRDGNLWVGTENQGLIRLSGGRASSLDESNGLTDSDVLSLFEDREGSVWVGTASGLERLRNTKLTTFGIGEGLPANSARSILRDRDGGLYILTKLGGLSRMKDDVISKPTLNPPLPLIYDDALHQSGDGSLWLGTSAGLTRIKDGKITTFRGELAGPKKWLPAWNRVAAKVTPYHFANRYISTIAEDEESLIVTNSECATFRFKDGKTSLFTFHGQSTPFSKPGLYTFTIYAAPSGTLWFGTSMGLYKLEPGAPPGKELQAEVPYAITSIYDDHQGNLWLGGRTPGLIRFHIADGHATHFTAKQGLFDGYVSHVLPDGIGNLWISTQNGIYSVSRQSLEEVAASRATIASTRVYGLADGMKTTQAADTTSQPSAARTADGRLWFATYKGVVAVDPRHLPLNTLIPPVILESVVTDGLVRQIQNGAQESLIVPPGMKTVEFQYTALSLSVPERVRFRYQLEGYDHGWVEAGSRRVAYYTNLPPGSYRFRVIAANDDGFWNEHGAAIGLTLKPFFYQTALFYVLCALWVVLAGIAMNRWNTRRIRRRAEELTAELKQSQRELQLLAHFDSLTALPNRRMFTEDFGNMRAMMNGKRFSLLLIDFDKFKQINDTHGHDAGDAFLVEASTRLKAAVRTSDRVARLGGDEFAILLAGDHDEASVQQVCGRIIESFGKEVDFRGANIMTSASIGVAVFPLDGATQEELYKAADLALYEAKRQGRNSSHRYTRSLDLARSNSLEAPRSLTDAVAQRAPALSQR